MKAGIACILLLLLIASLGIGLAAEGSIQPGVNYSTATLLEPGTYSFSIQPGDTHYFRVDLEEGETIFITLRMPRTVDFDIALVSPERDTIDIGVKGAGLTERIAYMAVRSGPHYIVVFPFGDSEGLYDLIISKKGPPTQTLTATVTETSMLTVTQYRYVEVPVTVTSEHIRTVTAREPIDQQAPWSALGMAAIAIALVAGAALMRREAHPLPPQAEGSKPPS